VPFREDWEAPTLTDVLALVPDENAEKDAPESDFMYKLRNLIGGGGPPAFAPEPGLLALKEMVATYVKLREFSNLPTRSILPIATSRASALG
jgi:hypothetical protein